MIIATSQDYALVAADCCPCLPPEAPAPRRECESKSVTRESVGWTFSSWRSAGGVFWDEDFGEDDIPCPDKVRRYRNVLQTYEQTSTDPEVDPYTESHEVSVSANPEYNSLGYPFPGTQIGDPFTGGPVDSYSDGVFSGVSEYDDGDFVVTTTATVVFTEPVDAEMMLAEVAVKLALLDWTTNGSCTSSSTFSNFLCGGLPTEEIGLINVTFSRYRIGIPASYSGRSYYEWQGDEVFFPTDPVIPPSLVATRSWTYDGTGEWSPWWEIALPTIPGETRLVNQLARHYRSTRLGNKPTAFGEVYEF